MKWTTAAAPCMEGMAATPSDEAAAPSFGRSGIRFRLTLAATVIVLLTAGLTVLSHRTLDVVQQRMETLAVERSEELGLVRSIHVGAESMFELLEALAGSANEEEREKRDDRLKRILGTLAEHLNAITLRVSEEGFSPELEQIGQARAAHAELVQAVDQLNAAVVARLQSTALIYRYRRDTRSAFNRHFEAATRAESQMRALAARALAADVPAAAAAGNLTQRLDALQKRELSWVGVAQDIRTDSRNLSVLLNDMEGASDPERIQALQGTIEIHAKRLEMVKLLPRIEATRPLAAATATYRTAVLGENSHALLREEELARGQAFSYFLKGTRQKVERFALAAHALSQRISDISTEKLVQIRVDVLRAQRLVIVMALAAGLVVMLGLYLFLTRRVVDPIEALTRTMRLAAQSVRDGDYAGTWSALMPAEIGGDDEVADMRRALRVYGQALAERQEALKHGEATLRSILLTVNEAIQLWDNKLNLVFANKATIDLFGLSRESDAEQIQPRLQYFREDGETCAADQLPHARALATGEAQAGAIVRVVAPAGHECWVRINAQPIFDDSGQRVIQVVSSCADISPLKKHQHQLEQMAHFDALTELPNRSLFSDRISQGLAKAQRENYMLAVCYLDLDGFKAVNDKYGHQVGDCLLIEIAKRIKGMLRGCDTVARLGGDEFALLLADVHTVNDLDNVLTRVIKHIAEPVMLGEGRSALVSASIGVTVYPRDGLDADTLLRHADHAMYMAKQSGKGCYHLYDPERDRQARAHRETVDRVREAIARGELRLHYQPKVDIANGTVIGLEALVRWQHPDRGLLPPGEFLPEIENTEVSVELDDWVIAAALEQMARWRTEGIDLQVSVNVGARQLQDKGFLFKLSGWLKRYPAMPRQRLQLEILETAALEDMRGVSEIMQQCRTLGVGFALDDFGTGYSSLTYFKQLPADALKIDRSFVRDMLTDEDDRLIIRAVVALAQAFGREVIAEGMETVEHAAHLIALGCTKAQGYGIARPLPPETIPGWVHAFRWKPVERVTDETAAYRRSGTTV